MLYKRHPEEKKTTSKFTKHYTKRIILSRGAIFLCICLFILYISIPTGSWVRSEEEASDVPNLSPPNQPFTQKQPRPPKPIRTWPEENRRNVSIYFATKWYGLEFAGTIISSQCSKDIQDWCSIVTSPNATNTADAVLFHNRDFNQTLYPKHRNLSQVYVMLTSESPVHEKVDFLPDQINWTMNYRRDSDVHYPYVIAEKRDQPENIDYDNIWNMKNSSLTAAWMVTNCYAANKRKEIAEKARSEGLSIDIFGDCGKPLEKCGRFSPDWYSCPAKVMKNYKFYLAFENSNCPDYVTEKLYNAYNLFFAIPIVLQRKNYEAIGIPSHSYIAVDDFSTLKELATFINELQKDKQRYLEYHKWRETYNVKTTDDNTGFCDLCKKLRSRSKSPQSYTDLPKWYSKDTCDTEALFPYVENVNS